MTDQLETAFGGRRKARNAAAVVAPVALTAALSACASETPAGDDAATTPLPDVSESAAATSTPSDTGSAAPDASASPGATAFVVNPVTVEGVTALLESQDDGVDRESVTITAKLITGPGGCLAFANEGEGAPRLVIFDDDTEVLSGKPGVKLDDNRTVHVGESVEWEVDEVPLDSLQGVPEQCLQGADAVAYEIDG